MLLIYTGDGKGKTSASVGQAVRAYGAGLVVAFAQFMKRDVKAGEQQVLRMLLGEAFYAGGLGFYRDKSKKAAHRAAAEDVLRWVHERMESGGVELLVLDEALYALGAELLKKEELESIIAWSLGHGCHLVLSGRGLPDWLREEADLVTEMKLIKHPYEKGIKAQRGIEF